MAHVCLHVHAVYLMWHARVRITLLRVSFSACAAPTVRPVVLCSDELPPAPPEGGAAAAAAASTGTAEQKADDKDFKFVGMHRTYEHVVYCTNSHFVSVPAVVELYTSAPGYIYIHTPSLNTPPHT